MAISVKHKFTSAKSDGADTTLIRPSNWNDDHNMTAAAGKVLGTRTDSTTVSELPIAVDPNGNVALDVNSTGTALRITQTGSGNALVVEDSANPDATPFVVSAIGNVGIGTTSSATIKLITANDRTVAAYNTVMSTYNGASFENDIITGFNGTAGFIGNFQNYRFDLITNAQVRFSVGESGQLGIGGANYGTSGQVLISNGASAAPSWSGAVSPIGQQTIWVPAVAMYGRTTNGATTSTTETASNRVMLKTMDFDGSAQEFAQFAIQMPKGWNEGTLVCQFVWTHGATTTNFGVVWAIEAVAFGDDDAADAAFGTAVQVADIGGTTNDIYISGETSAMTVAGSPGPEEWVVFQVKRVPADASDTMTVDAKLLGVKIHYTLASARDD